MSIDDALALIARVRDAVTDTADRRAGLEYAGRRAGAVAEQLAGEYPVASGRPLAVFYDRTDANGRAYKSKFKSLRQQRKVILLGKQGKIPTRRSGLLGRTMTSDAISNGDGVVINVGTNDPSAKYVIGKETQSHYHEGTWTPLQDRIAAGKAQIIGEFQTSLTGWLRGYLSGGGK